MPNYVEILRLYELSYSLRHISRIVGSSRHTVTHTVRLAQEKQLSYRELSTWSSEEVIALLGPKSSTKSREENYELPNYEMLAKELVKPGVTMQLL